MLIKTYSKTDVGKKRKTNQDCVFTSETPVGNLPNLFAVADGMEESLDRIAAIRAEAEKQGKELDIEVDGGIGAGNAGRVTAAGANVLVAGSAVFRGNIGNNVKALLNAMNGGEA